MICFWIIKKFVGILTESCTTQDGLVKFLLISVGFNVNEINFPDNLSDIATSLKREYNHNFDKQKILIAFLKKLEETLKNNEII